VDDEAGRKEVELQLSAMVEQGLLEVSGPPGNRRYKLTKSGKKAARRVLIDMGADPDDKEQIEGAMHAMGLRTPSKEELDGLG
jgi:DNA-binding PadR family transcriptional regulator